MDERPEQPGPEGVADAAWDRVRELAGRADALERLAALDPDPDPELAMRLARVRAKAGRAVDRAELADALADRLGELERSRRRSQAELTGPHEAP
ncbi:MAG TPA: hypothetical protein VKD47_06675 [Miltoncostaeaceae bacterium]|nr:hypothetical protein [Miltoncostaeaceae bacterium]